MNFSSMDGEVRMSTTASMSLVDLVRQHPALGAMQVDQLTTNERPARA
ncbi:hypothetical protein [Aeromicrobium sp. UC242_57]